MKKLILFVLLSFITISCSTTSNKHTDENTIYRINKADVTLVSKCKGDKYPNQEQLAEIFTNKIKREFCSKKKCTDNKMLTDNVVDLYFDITYFRVFMGEFFFCSNSYGLSVFTFRNSAKMNDKIIVEHNSSGKMFYSGGLIRNLVLIVRQLTFSGDAALEDKTLDGISKYFSKKMIKQL
jgi:hypothetical protein